MEINLPEVRISYPHLFEPYAGPDNGKPKYSAKFMISKATQGALVAQIANAIKQMAADNYKDKKLPPADKLCMRDGDLTGRDEDVGYWLLSASDDARPVVVDRARRPLVAEDDVIYPGCVVNAKIRLWPQDNKYGRRINANLMGVQFCRDGDRLGTGRTRQSADEMFEDAGDFGDDGSADPFA